MKYIVRVFADVALILLLLILIAAPVSLSALVKVAPSGSYSTSLSVLGAKVSQISEGSPVAYPGLLYRVRLEAGSEGPDYLTGSLIIRNISSEVNNYYLIPFSDSGESVSAFFNRTMSDHLAIRPGEQEIVSVSLRATPYSPSFSGSREIYLFVGEK